MKWAGRSLNIVFFLVTFAYVVVSLGYGRTPRLFPLFVSLPMLLLTGFQTVIDFFPQLSKKYAEAGTLDAEMLAGVAVNQQTEEDPQRVRRELEIFLWLGVALALIMSLGLLIAMPVFVFVVLRLRYLRSWSLSLSLALGTFVFMYLLFVKFFHIPLFKGLYFDG
jgi:hypothetical protein